MKALRKHYKLILRVFTSHIVITLALLLALNLGSIMLYRSMQNKIISYNAEQTMRFREFIDSDIAAVNELVSKLVTNRDIIELKDLQTPTTMKEQYPVWKAKDYLAKTSKEFGNDFYIYLRRNDLMISKNNIYIPFQKSYGDLYSFSDLSYKEFTGEVLGLGRIFRYIPAGQMRLAASPSSGALYIREITSAHFYGNAVMVYPLNETYLKAQLAAFLGEDHQAYIYHEDNLLLSLGEGEPDPAVLSEKSSLTARESSVNGLTVCTSVPKSVAFHELAPIRWLLILLNVTAIFFILFYIAHLASRYSKELSDVLPEIQGQSKDSQNLFASLNAYYVSLRNINTQMEETMMRQMVLARSVVMRNLIGGSLDSDLALTDLLRRAGMDLEDYGHNVVVISAHQESGVSGLINETLEAIFADHGYFYQQSETSWFILTNISVSQTMNAKKIVEAFWEQLLAALPEEHIHSLRCCASPVFVELGEVGKQYANCRQQLAHLQNHDYAHVFWAQEMGSIEYDRPSFSPEMEDQIISLIQAGNYAGSQEYIGQVIDSNLLSRQLDDFGLRLFVAHMQLLLYKCSSTESYPLIEETLIGLEKASGIEEITAQILSTCKTLCGYNALRQESHTYKFSSEVIRYIKDNFTDSELTLQRTAGQFGFSTSYFSTQFKDLIGETFSSYLDRMRMVYADQLVCTTNTKIEEIASETGYHSVNTFSKAYKRYFGTTPSQKRSVYAAQETSSSAL